MLARIALAEGGDPTPHFDEIRAWTSRTGDMEWIIEAHLLAARYLLALARRAFTRALEVRRRIEHPGASETERWLVRTG